MFRPNIFRRNLKANPFDAGAQNVMVPETRGLNGETRRDMESVARCPLRAGSTPFPVSYCKEIGLGCGGWVLAEGEKGWLGGGGWRVEVALTENMPLTETNTDINRKKVIENICYWLCWHAQLLFLTDRWLVHYVTVFWNLMKFFSVT